MSKKTTLTDLIRSSLTPLISLQLLVLTVSGVALTWDSTIMYVMPFLMMLFVSPMLYPFFLVPAGIMSNIMNITSIAFPKFSAFMLGMTILYILGLMTGSAVLTFKWIYPCMQGDLFYTGLVFGAVASVAPWSTFALKDRNNVFFSGIVLMMQIAMSVMVLVGVLWLKWPLKAPMMNNALLLFFIMVALVVAQAIYEKKHPEEKEALFTGNTRAVEEAEARMKAELEAEEAAKKAQAAQKAQKKAAKTKNGAS